MFCSFFPLDNLLNLHENKDTLRHCDAQHKPTIQRSFNPTDRLSSPVLLVSFFFLLRFHSSEAQQQTIRHKQQQATNMSFKIGVVGGTRGVGRLVVEQALERGWTVNALARNPVALDDLKQRFPELLVVTKGDVLDPASDGLDQILSASQSVVISLGSSTIMRRVRFFFRFPHLFAHKLKKEEKKTSRKRPSLEEPGEFSRGPRQLASTESSRFLHGE